MKRNDADITTELKDVSNFSPFSTEKEMQEATVDAFHNNSPLFLFRRKLRYVDGKVISESL